MTKNSKELFKTFVISVSALIVLAIWLKLQPKAPVSEPKEMVGKKLFAAFNDPLSIRTLEIVRLDSKTGEKKSLRVCGAEGHWRIETHYNVPAENAGRMTQVVSPFLQLTVQGLFDELRGSGDSKRVLDLYRSCHVVDPSGAAPEDKEFTGILVKMTGQNEEVLVNAIIGEKVPESTQLRDVRYLRIPGEDMIYTVDFSTEATEDSGAERLLPMSDRLSVDPLEWMNRDLLRISRWSIKNWGIHRYTVSESGDPIPGAFFSFDQSPEKAIDSVWTLADNLLPKDGKYQTAAEKKIPVNKKINEAADALGHLKFTDVKRLPESWGKIFREKKSLRELLLKKEGSIPQGFRVVNFDLLHPSDTEPVLAGTNGNIELVMKEGIILSICFGRQIDKNIALLVSAKIDPDLLKEPKAVPLAKERDSKGTGDQQSLSKADENIRKAERELQFREAQKLVAFYKDRFTEWIYYIDIADFEKIKPSENVLLK